MGTGHVCLSVCGGYSTCDGSRWPSADTNDICQCLTCGFREILTESPTRSVGKITLHAKTWQNEIIKLNWKKFGAIRKLSNIICM